MSKFWILITSISGLALAAQKQDSVQLISEVKIDAYRKPTMLMNSTKSATVAGSNLLNQNQPERLLESLNLLPGAKMEERSPGSYRLAVRGSSLRSPFGIRNIKIYLDDFALTDASGNSYLNLLDPALFSEIEVFRGPESGDFGAVTGGTTILKTTKQTQQTASITGGSYERFSVNLNYVEEFGKHFLQAFGSYTTSDSYREQSALERKFLFLKHQYTYGEGNELKSMLWFSNLHYETPGGLTFEQMMSNPRQARPQSPATPSAVDQQAGIFNKMIFAGISNLYHFDKSFSHFIALQGNYNDFKNPFITNFEKRFENNLAIRTHLNFDIQHSNTFYQTRIGFEGATSEGIIRNYDNNLGIAGDPQNFDDLKTKSGFVFLSQKAEFNDNLFIDLAGSLNLMNYEWQSILPNQENGRKTFKNQFLPNLGITYRINEQLSLRGKLGKGNSAPTTEEIRSSAQEINTNLDAEYGWKKEIGIRKQWGNFLFTEVSVFDFRLKNAIVRRENDNSQEYFVNAGETVQKGLEFIMETKKFTFKNPILNELKLYFSGNFYDFTFKNYQKNDVNYSGNDLTGVPPTSLQSLLTLKVLNKILLDLSHFYTSEIPLNDANTVIAPSSLVGNLSAALPVKLSGSEMMLKFSVQNLYNAKYSLGYDINAFGSRYYNPAAERNFLVSLYFKL